MDMEPLRGSQCLINMWVGLWICIATDMRPLRGRNEPHRDSTFVKGNNVNPKELRSNSTSVAMAETPKQLSRCQRVIRQQDSKTKEQFTLPVNFNLKGYFSECFGITKDENYEHSRRSAATRKFQK